MKNIGENMARLRRRITHLGLAAGLLVTGLVAGPWTAHEAGAIWTTCNGDPIVWLSNGDKIQINVSINDTASDVQNVTYLVEGPAGTTVSQIVYTGGALSGLETVQFVADEPAGTYDTSTLVTTGTPDITLSGETTINPQGKPLSGSNTGVAGVGLPVHLSYTGN
jgi:hypothetical protein